MNHLQHNLDMNDYADKAHRVLEYDPQSMIDDINKNNNDLKFTTAGEYMNDVNNYATPTGGETWQTKATAKGAVPRYMSPSELAHMRLDKLEQSLLRLAKDLRGRMDTLESRLHSLERSMENK